jgi:hypothetical protein
MITHTLPAADYLAWAKIRARQLLPNKDASLAQFVADLSLHKHFNVRLKTIGAAGIECVIRQQDYEAWLDSVKP